ncbi:zinc finger protein 585A-like [Neocloeon triangulifer]|uniref:zinc finger protein 585A-like n=1 Tax=Neocloeon triangulifer TaxID=2078957 RepID=UPI00286EF871|nr:zinc finger protein 585A-like [Neocloeon triangulifer]
MKRPRPPEKCHTTDPGGKKIKLHADQQKTTTQSCRLCLRPAEKPVSLGLIGLENIQRWVADFVGIEIKFSSGFSESICWPCFTTLKTWANELKIQAARNGDAKLNSTGMFWNEIIKNEIVEKSSKINVNHSTLEVEESSSKSTNFLRIEAIHSATEVKECSVQLEELDDDFIVKCCQGKVDLHSKEKENSTREKSFSCPVCKLVFCSSSSLKLHLEQTHPDLKSCPNCHLTFTWRRSLTKHVMEKSCLISRKVNQSAFFCPKCPRSFDSLPHLAAHLKGQHPLFQLPNAAYPCKNCCNVYMSLKQLSDHFRHVHGDFSCEVCDEEFPARTLIMNHLIEKHPGFQLESFYLPSDEKKFCCAVCEFKFNKFSAVARHFVKYHKNQIPMMLNKDELFAELTDETVIEGETSVADEFELEPDEEVEEAESEEDDRAVKVQGGCDIILGSISKKLSCVHCQEEFNKLIDAVSHMKVKHSSQLPICCPGCGIGNFNKPFLTDHVASCEKVPLNITKQLQKDIALKNSITYKCPHCPQIFKLINTANLMTHYEKKHLSKLCFKCPGCCLLHPTPQHLLSHLLSCKKIQFSSYLPQASTSVSEAEEGEYKCALCSKQFATSALRGNHLLIHRTKAKVFECDYCSRIFTKKLELIVHILAHQNQPANMNFEPKFQCCVCFTEVYTDIELARHLQFAHLNRISFSKKSKESQMVVAVRSMQVQRLSVKNKNRDIQFDPQTSILRYQGKNICCQLCPMIYCNEAWFTRHMEKQHSNLIICSGCGTRFSLLIQMKNHFRTCNKMAADQKLLMMSQLSPKYTSEWVCKPCQKVMYSMTEVDSHILRCHKQFENLQCNQCNLHFISKQALEEHRKMHQLPKQILMKTCMECKISFDSEENLCRHNLLKHSTPLTNDKQPPLKICEKCKANFDSEAQLLRHDLLKHMTHENITCKFCFLMFPKVDLLITHILRQHPEKAFTCEICKMPYINKFMHKCHNANNQEVDKAVEVSKPLTVDAPKRSRGRPRKNPEPTFQIIDNSDNTGKKRGRGRPRKNPVDDNESKLTIQCKTCKMCILRCDSLAELLKKSKGAQELHKCSKQQNGKAMSIVPVKTIR